MKRLRAVLLAAIVGIASVSGTLVTADASETYLSGADPYDQVLVDSDDQVVVVDPGHGGYRSTGAVAHGLVEKKLTPVIAKYLKQRLLEYDGVRVYQTRYKDKAVGLTARADYAANIGATALVSVHLNGAGPKAHGYTVFYPNSHYDSDCHTIGKAMAQGVARHLSEDVGISEFGSPTRIRNSANRTKYPDGSLADYYSLIRNGKLNFVPTIIMEPCFITNKSDCRKYLNTTAKLKKIGYAEADGIAEGLGLTYDPDTKRPDKTILTQVQATGNGSDVAISWQATENTDEYVILRRADSDDSWEEVDTTTETSYTDTTADYDTTYYYTVIGRNKKGRSLSYDEDGLEVTTPSQVVSE